MNGGHVHRTGTIVLSLAMIAIGVGLVVQVIDGRSSGISSRLLLGALFLAAGVGRAYLEIRRGRGA